MGMQDRDYYKEWWAKREGYTEKAKFRLPARGFSSPKSPDWHWFLQLLLLVAICLCVFGFFKFLKYFV